MFAINIKKSLFVYLTQRQKSQLFGTLSAYVQKFPELCAQDLLYKFLDDEKYYLDMGNPHFEFVGDYFNNDKFLKDIEKYFNHLKKEQAQKEKMRPYIDKQKAYAKQMRQKAKEYRLSKLPPTKKQIKYYLRLVRVYDLELKDVNNASRLDLMNWIDDILSKYENNFNDEQTDNKEMLDKMFEDNVEQEVMNEDLRLEIRNQIKELLKKRGKII